MNETLEPKNVAQFRAVATALANTYAEKNRMYNDSFSESVERYGIVAAITRLSDKFHRAENLLVFNKAPVNFESAEDTLLDLAAYSIMTVMEIRKAQTNQNKMPNGANDTLSER